MNLKSLVKNFHQHPEGRYFFPLANAYREEHKLDESINVLRKGLSVFPNYWAARVALARSLMEKNYLEEALKELETAAIHVPENLLLHELLASIYFKKGNLDKAAYHCQMVLFDHSSHRECLAIMAEAAKVTDNYLKMDNPDSQDLLLHEVVVDKTDKKWSITDQEEEEIVTATLAELYLSQGLTDKGIEIYQKLLKQQPDRTEEWERRIAALKKGEGQASFPSASLSVNTTAKKDKSTTLYRLNRWLKNIENYEKE